MCMFVVKCGGVSGCVVLSFGGGLECGFWSWFTFIEIHQLQQWEIKCGFNALNTLLFSPLDLYNPLVSAVNHQHHRNIMMILCVVSIATLINSAKQHGAAMLWSERLFEVNLKYNTINCVWWLHPFAICIWFYAIKFCYIIFPSEHVQKNKKTETIVQWQP